MDLDESQRRQGAVDALTGWLVYPAGDLVAQLISGEVSLFRLVVMALAGGLLYRYEVPWWFSVLDRTELSTRFLERFRGAQWFVVNPKSDRQLNWLGRTVGAILYFNPLWITRHMLFIRLGSDPMSLAPFGAAVSSAFAIGLKSFIINLPIAIPGNYLVQVRPPLRWRFLAAATFSGILAAGYALAYRYL